MYSTVHPQHSTIYQVQYCFRKHFLPSRGKLPKFSQVLSTYGFAAMELKLVGTRSIKETLDANETAPKNELYHTITKRDLCWSLHFQCDQPRTSRKCVKSCDWPHGSNFGIRAPHNLLYLSRNPNSIYRRGCYNCNNRRQSCLKLNN